MTEAQIEDKIEEIMEMVDNLIEPPMTQERAIEVLEDLETNLQARLAGIKADMEDEGDDE